MFSVNFQLLSLLFLGTITMESIWRKEKARLAPFICLGTVERRNFLQTASASVVRFVNHSPLSWDSSSAGLIPNNLWLIQHKFLTLNNRFFFTIPWPKIAKKNWFSIPKNRKQPSARLSVCSASRGSGPWPSLWLFLPFLESRGLLATRSTPPTPLLFVRPPRSPS